MVQRRSKEFYGRGRVWQGDTGSGSTVYNHARQPKQHLTLYEIYSLTFLCP